MTVQTTKKDPSNRYEKGLFKLKFRVRSIWQGWQDVVQTFDEDLSDVDVAEIRSLLDKGEKPQPHPAEEDLSI